MTKFCFWKYIFFNRSHSYLPFYCIITHPGWNLLLLWLSREKWNPTFVSWNSNTGLHTGRKQIHISGFMFTTHNLLAHLVGKRDSTGSNQLSQLFLLIIELSQRSILDSLLFKIYTYLFPNVVKVCKSHMYADDFQLYFYF